MKIKILIIIIVLFVFTSININEKENVIIGIISHNKAKDIEKYLNDNINNYNIILKEIEPSKSDDPFLATQYAIHDNMASGEVDMLLNINEDYLNPLIKDNIFLDIKNYIDLNALNLSFKNHFIKNDDGNIFYLPSTNDTTRFIILNLDLFKDLDVNYPSSQFSIKDLIELSYELNNKITSSNKGEFFAMTFGSPIDEYLFDDVDKILLPLKDYNDFERYKHMYYEIIRCAKNTSYLRNTIGHEYPMDFYFSKGNVAMKICTTYELFLFKNNSSPYLISDFEYKILPLPYISEEINYTNTKITVMAISKETKNIKGCIEVFDYILSKENAINTLRNETPLSNNIISLPLYIDEEIESMLENLIGTSDIYYGNNIPTNYFVKNYDFHWEKIRKRKELTDKYVNDVINIVQYKEEIDNIIDY